MRYFVIMSRGEPYNLYRFDVINEDRWFPTQGWTPTRVISAYLVMGEGDYEEITESLAMESFPDAFAMAKSIGNYAVSKAEDAKRYTLGAMYIPDQIDAHNEWTDSNELQRAVWDYVKSNDRRIRLQHNRDVVAGEWVEVMSFPYELTVPIQSISGIEINHTYPANTVFLGVIWEPWAWDLVKSGQILGYSIGGKAERLYVDMEILEKEDGPSVNSVHVDTIMSVTKPKRKKVKDEAK
jgi:hypothetical protein